jgi:hypothetical protein
MNQWVVTVEGVDYDVDAPDEITAWKWANQYHNSLKQQQPSQPQQQQQQPEQAQPSPMDQFKQQLHQQPEEMQGMLEAGSTLLRQMPGYVAGGLVGAGAAVSGQGIDAAAQQQKYVQESLNKFFGAEPKTERGAAYTQALSEAFQYPIERAREIGSAIGGSEGELAAGIAAETLLNFMPLGAGKKALEKQLKTKPENLEPKAKLDKNAEILENLDKVTQEHTITSEEIAIDKQKVYGQQYGGRNALGVEFPELRVRERPEELKLELLDKDKYPVDDGGVRYLDPDTGKVVQGMAEDVPTIDFPLRQEVLNSPEVSEKINEYIAKAEQYKEKGNTEALAKLQNEFAEFMKLYGMYPYQFGTELKGLYGSVYEGDIPSLKYPGGIRKSGEINPTTTETEIPKVKWEPNKIAAFKKQMGAIDPKVFEEGLKKLSDLVGKAKDLFTFTGQKDITQLESYKKILPYSSVKDALIPKDIPVETVINEALKSNPVSDKVALIGGGAMMAEIKKNPIISAVVQWADNAEKRAQYSITKYVDPAVESIKAIGRSEKDLKLLVDIFLKEFKEGKQYGPEALQKAGANPKVVTAYSKLREAFDRAYEAENNALIAMGKEPLTRLEAYFASRWNGDWRIPVYTKDGKLVWWIAAQTRWGAERAFEYVKKNFDDIDLKRSKLTYSRSKNPLTSSKAEAGYYELLQVLDRNDPRVETLKSIYEDYVAVTGFNELAQSKHFEHKAGVRGFIGDRPWSRNDAIEFLKQQVNYIENAFKWSEDQAAVQKAKQVFSDENLQELHQNAIKIAQEYMKNRLGFGEKPIFSAIEGEIAKALGVSRSTLSKIVDVPRRLFYLFTLGFFEPGFTAISLTQPINTMPWHLKLLKEGYDFNPISTISKSTMDSVGLFLDNYHRKGTFSSEIGYLASKYAVDNGVIDITPLSDVAELSLPAGVAAAEKLAALNMTSVEQLTRAYTFMSFVHHLHESGKFKGMEMEMFQKAEELTKLSMADYRRSERAPLFNRMGMLGSALSTLQTYKVNIFNQLYALGKHGVQTGDYLPLTTALMLNLTLAGARGAYGIATVDAAWEFIKKMLPTDLWAKVKDYSIRNALAKLAFENPDLSWITHGAISKLTGINLSGRFDTGSIIDPTFEGLLPFMGDVMQRSGDIAGMVTNPEDPVSVALGKRAMLPRAFQGLYEANSDVFSPKLPEGGAMGTKLRDPLVGVYPRTEGENLLRKFNLYSLPEGIVRELDYYSSAQEKETSKRVAELSDKIKRTAMLGSADKLPDLIQQYYEINGDFPKLEKMIGEAAINRMTTKLERLQMGAKTPTGVRKFLDYVGK